MERRNYLNDSMEIKFTKGLDYKTCSESRNNCGIRTTICGKCYKDPDLYSKQLYIDMAKVFKDLVNDKPIMDRRWVLVEKKVGTELSADYIGPSRTLAKSENISDEDIGKFLLVSREIGGHIFWPARRENNAYTINQARGCFVHDRIDITLAELKNFLEKKEFLFSKRLYSAFDRYSDYFEKCFDNEFNTFIEKMKLSMFIGKDGVYSLAESDFSKNKKEYVGESEGIKPKDYGLYINNCITLINDRTKMILTSSSTS